MDLDRKYELVLVAIVRSEDPYLVEWIEFHRLMGVDHFFIYDNGCDPRTEALLKSYVREGLVNYMPFPDREGLRKDNRNQDDLSIQNLASLPEDRVMGVEIPMYVFGSDGHEQKPEG